jgi:[ribosomal protein S18]-alanine N-acetyltransferase
VHTIGVDPAWQRQGVGRALLNTLLAKADEARAPVFLEVRTDNVAAIAMYEAHGFSRIGLRRRYYQPSGADAYTMARPARKETA